MIADIIKKHTYFRNAPASIKTLIVYDDIALGTRTRNFLSRFSQNANCDFQIWHCFAPLLDMNSVRILIRRRVETMDMIFVALSQDEASVEHIHRLLNSWTDCIYSNEKILVAVCDDDFANVPWYDPLATGCSQAFINFAACQFHEI